MFFLINFKLHKFIFRRQGVVLLLSFLTISCAHLNPVSTKDSKSASPIGSKPPVSQPYLDLTPSNEASQKDNPKRIVVHDGVIEVQGIRLKNTAFDFPVTINSQVEKWIDYFCGRGRPHFEKYLERSEYFIPYIVPILAENGLPQDLVYLAMIESGFNNLARSRARAVGPWQFMSATGKRYGLLVNWWVDERRDIRKSTLAAVRYLSDLYGIFQNWELAAAAYNAGESKVARAVRRYGTKDFWAISKTQFLRPETRSYVPKMIAAALISKNRAQFGFPETYIEQEQDEIIAGDGALVKVEQEVAGVDQRGLPSSEGGVTDDPNEPEPQAQTSQEAGAVLAKDDAELLISELSTPQAMDVKPVPTPHISKNGKVSGEELLSFEIKSPADLLTVARAAGLSYRTVKSLNPEILRWCTPPGLGSFRIKLPASAKDRFLTTYNHPSYPRKVQFLKYRVRKKDSLRRIARHFGVEAISIADLNGFSTRTHLRAGTYIQLPMPTDRTRSIASLDLKDPPRRAKKAGKKRQNNYRVTHEQRKEARTKGSPAES